MRLLNRFPCKAFHVKNESNVNAWKKAWQFLRLVDWNVAMFNGTGLQNSVPCALIVQNRCSHWRIECYPPLDRMHGTKKHICGERHLPYPGSHSGHGLSPAREGRWQPRDFITPLATPETKSLKRKKERKIECVSDGTSEQMDEHPCVSTPCELGSLTGD